MPVFLFPGQGAQFSGMAMDLYDADLDEGLGVKALFNLASDILGSDIRLLLNSDAEKLKQTDVSQVAITVASLATSRVLKSRGIHPSACAGFSLGEYAALAVAGVISEADAIRLTNERGRIMQEVCTSMTGAGMVAVLGLTADQIDSVISSFSDVFTGGGVYAANYNSPLQCVISGTAEALVCIEDAFKKAGARRIVTLKVGGPFHSPLMAKAGKEFSQILDTFTFLNPIIPLFSNVTGAQVSSGDEAKQNAVLHISSPVLWTKEESAISAFLVRNGSLMAEEGECPALVEVGPGKVLSGLWADSKLPGNCKPYTEIGRNLCC